MNDYDTIVVGAGHNGLVCATYLANAGKRVLLLEAASDVGGLACPREFHPGFRAPIAHYASHFSTDVVRELKLAEHGLKVLSAAPSFSALATDGNHVSVRNSELQGADRNDAAAYQELNARLQRYAAALAPFWNKTMPRIGAGSLGDMMTFGHLGLNLRRLGKDDMHEFMRVFSLPARDLMDETFDSPLVKALLSWDGLIGSRLAPRSPNSAVLAMLYRRAGQAVDASTLPPALKKAAVAAGVDIKCVAPVEQILIDTEGGLRAAGVQLQNGEQISASQIISAVDPKQTFLKLLGVEYLDIGFTNRVNRLRCNGYVGKLHLALSALPAFRNIDAPNGRLLVAPEMDAIEFAFDDAKYGEASANPVLDVAVPSLDDASLAPAGQHVLSAHVMYVPYQHKHGWSDAARSAARDRAITTLAQYAPDIEQRILHAEFLTPADIEDEYRLTGGHWHHTEFAMDQMLMMRPTYGAAQYATPVPGLWLCSAGCHPGGDLTGMAGRNAANEVLR